MANYTGSFHDATEMSVPRLPGQDLHPGRAWTSFLQLLRGPALLLTALWLLCGFAVVQAQTFEHIPSLSFTKAYEGADPLSQVISLASTGNAFNFRVNATTATCGNWLTITDSSGYTYATPTAVTVAANPAATLAAGTYSGQIIATATTGSVTLTIPVSLTIAPTSAAFFDNLPGALTFSMLTKGSAPPAQPLQIRNAGAGTLNFTASATTADGGSWLKLSATTGTAPSLLSVTLAQPAFPAQASAPAPSPDKSCSKPAGMPSAFPSLSR